MKKIGELSHTRSARVLAGLEGPQYQQMLQDQLELLELVEIVTRSTTATNSRRIASAFHEFYDRKINPILIQRELRVLEKEGVVVLITEGSDVLIQFTPLGGVVLRLWRSRRNGDQ